MVDAGISLSSTYDLIQSNITTNEVKIELVPVGVLTSLTTITSTEQLLAKGTITVQNIAVDPGITYNLAVMQSMSKFYEGGAAQIFDTVIVDGDWRLFTELLCPVIDSISPRQVASGVNGLSLNGVAGKITIYGKNFGNPTSAYIKPRLSDVLFYNVDQGYFEAGELDYISWNDTKIEVEVSSMVKGQLPPPPNDASPAATTGHVGVFVRNFFTGDTCTSYSDSLIYVHFSMFNNQWYKDILNWEISPGNVINARIFGGKRRNLYNKNENGGYGYRIIPFFTDTVKNNAIEEQFLKALNIYRCGYKIFIEDTVSSEDIRIQKGALPTGVTATTIMKTDLFTFDCDNTTDKDAEFQFGRIIVNSALLDGYSPMAGDTFKFNIFQAIPADTNVIFYADFQGTMIHELGHAFQLQHTNNPGDMMQSGIIKNPKFNNFLRTLSANDMLGMEHVYLLSKVGGCSTLSLPMDDYLCSTNTKNLTNNSLKIYPNPTYEYFVLENFGDYKIASLEMYSVAGQKTSLTWENTPGKVFVNLPSNLPNGLYYIRVNGNSGIFSGKIIIEK